MVETRTGWNCRLLVGVCCAVATASCVTMEPLGGEVGSLVGGSVGEVEAVHGAAHLAYELADGSRLLAYRLHDDSLPRVRPRGVEALPDWRCSVLYTFRAGEVGEIELVGPSCVGDYERAGNVNDVAEAMIDRDVVAVLGVFGAPDAHELAGGTGTLVYRLRIERSVWRDCVVEFELEDGRIVDAKTRGGACWATRM